MDCSPSDVSSSCRAWVRLRAPMRLVTIDRAMAREVLGPALSAEELALAHAAHAARPLIASASLQVRNGLWRFDRIQVALFAPVIRSFGPDASFRFRAWAAPAS